MPVYNLPLDNPPPMEDRPNMSNDDLTRSITKAFLSSPSFSRKFMNNAQQAIQGRMESVPDETTRTAFAGPAGAIPTDVNDLLARTIAAEAGAHPQDQPHVASVIMNRVASPNYPNNVRDVILQPGQFSAWNALTGYAGGQGANDIVNRPAPPSITELAARAAGQGWAPTTDALNYYNPDAADPAWGGDGFDRIGNTAHVYGTARR